MPTQEQIVRLDAIIAKIKANMKEVSDKFKTMSPELVTLKNALEDYADEPGVSRVFKSIEELVPVTVSEQDLPGSKMA
jgi:hypothetical protein